MDIGHRSRLSIGTAAAMILVLILLVQTASAQALSFSTGHREIQPPDYATFRIGPLYSDFQFSQSVGYRYTANMEDVIDMRTGLVRGVIKDDGSEFPLESVLTVRNYVLLSKYADMDLSLIFTYMHFPLETQEDQFLANITDEEIRAEFSAELMPTEYLKVLIYARPVYVTDFIDLRGVTDEYGGGRFERFENELGLNADLLVVKDANLGLSIERVDVVPSGDEFEDQERVSHSGSIYYQQEVTPRLFAGVTAEMGASDYPGAVLSESSGRSVRASATALLSKTTTLRSSLGYGVSSLSASSLVTMPDVDYDGIIGGISLKAEIARGLSASVEYDRSQARGFTEGIDVSDVFRGAITWRSEGLSILFATVLSDVDVVGGAVSSYADWRNELRITYPLSSEMVFTLTSLYAARTAGAVSEGSPAANVADELVSDYTTWTSRAGTELAVARDASISIYAQYAIRGSGNEDLEYESFQGGVELRYTFTHDF